MSRTDERRPALGTRGHAVLAEKVKTAIKAAVESRQRQLPYHGVRCIRCDFHEGVLMLRGCAASYYLKQITQTLVRGMEGGDMISNRVEVVGLPGQSRAEGGDRHVTSNRNA